MNKREANNPDNTPEVNWLERATSDASAEDLHTELRGVPPQGRTAALYDPLEIVQISSPDDENGLTYDMLRESYQEALV
jgi:hypothetical protein